MPDAGVAKGFYGAAFGWEFRDWGADYVSFTAGRLEGGFREHEFPGGRRFHFADPMGNVLGVWTKG